MKIEMSEKEKTIIWFNESKGLQKDLIIKIESDLAKLKKKRKIDYLNKKKLELYYSTGGGVQMMPHSPQDIDLITDKSKFNQFWSKFLNRKLEELGIEVDKQDKSSPTKINWKGLPIELGELIF